MSGLAGKKSLFAIIATLAIGGGGCGGEPFCGDGNVDPGEQCDDGNSDDTDFCLSTCLPRPIPTLTVKWSFNVDEERAFDGDSCTDTGAREVNVDLNGPISEQAEESCSFRQVTFSDIPAGSYDVGLAVRDGGGSSLLVSEVVNQTVEFGGGDEEVTVNVPYKSWNESFKGNFFFNVTYGGMGCTDASVVSQALTFTYFEGGSQVAAITKTGAPLDGTPSSCYSLAESEPQTVLDVPFGPATLLIQGLDADSTVIYESTFDTFIGAGLLNAEQDFDVAALVP